MIVRAAVHGCVVVILTLLTQIGGLAWLATFAGRRRGVKRLVAFVPLYALLSIACVFVAPAFGRVALPCLPSENRALNSRSVLFCALNRHYVTPDVLDYATRLADAVDAAHPGTRTLTLDGNFPFLRGMPLLPHLSHDDGGKLDFAFYFTDETGRYLPGKTPSPIGYWGFVAGEPEPACQGVAPTLRWDMGWFQGLVRDMPMDVARTATALRWVAANPPPGGKVLIEPHLQGRFNLPGHIFRFQGCRAARHDDHWHLHMAGG